MKPVNQRIRHLTSKAYRQQCSGEVASKVVVQVVQVVQQFHKSQFTQVSDKRQRLLLHWFLHSLLLTSVIRDQLFKFRSIVISSSEFQFSEPEKNQGLVASSQLVSYRGGESLQLNTGSSSPGQLGSFPSTAYLLELRSEFYWSFGCQQFMS